VLVVHLEVGPVAVMPVVHSEGGGRGGGRGGAGGAKVGARVVVEPHLHAGVFVDRLREDMLVTKNLSPGELLCGEGRISHPPYRQSPTRA